MNWGLSDKLTIAFPDVVPVERPVVELPETLDPRWLAGFTSGEGSFIITILHDTRNATGFKVQLEFVITQHAKDELLIKSIRIYFNCGVVFKNRDTYYYRVRKFDDINNKIIPFFNKYPIVGVKAMDFADWREAGEIMKKKKHLTKEGFEEIKKIKAGMNRGRKFNSHE